MQDIAWNAQKRLCVRYRLLDGKGKLKVQVCTAIARELTGFIWAIGQQRPAEPVTPSLTIKEAVERFIGEALQKLPATTEAHVPPCSNRMNFICKLSIQVP